MSEIIKRLRNPPFGTETSERNLMAAAADQIELWIEAAHKLSQSGMSQERFVEVYGPKLGKINQTTVIRAESRRANEAEALVDKQRALIETLVKALEECAQRNVYDGDYFHDIGLSDRMRASWNAERQARSALEAAKEITQ